MSVVEGQRMTNKTINIQYRVSSMKYAVQRGASLIEVMVALFVLAIGLLGMLALQTKSMQFNQSAYSYSQAVFLANDLAERIRTNSGEAAAYLLAENATPAEVSCNSPTASCTVAQLAGHDVYAWRQNVETLLPMGTGTVENFAMGSRNFMRITVAFDDSRSSAIDGSGSPPAAEDLPEARKNYVLLVEI